MPRSGEPMWHCYECNAEMRPLMMPDPHCASCQSTFVEQIENPEDDPRNFQIDGGLHFHGEDDGMDLDDGFGTHGAGVHAETVNGVDAFGLLMAALGGAVNRQQQQQQPQGQGQPPPAQQMPGSLPRSASVPAPAPGQRPVPPGPPGTAPAGTPGVRMEVRQTPDGGRLISLNFASGTRTMGGRPQQQQGPAQVQAGAGAEGGTRVDMDPGAGFAQFLRHLGNVPPTPAGAENADGQHPTDGLMAFQNAIAALFGGGPGGAHGFFMGPAGNTNWGDYVLNNEALDHIITQLMENTAGSRPVPVPEDKIDSLPHTKYSSTESNTLTKDCAVCKDDFEEEQEIITLPCRHAFHDECIVPWLKVNGTCPVCRFELVPQPKPGHPAAADGGHGTQGADGGASTNQNQEQSQGGSGMFGGRSTPRQSNNGVGGQGPGQQQFSGSWSGQGQWQGTSGMFSGRINPNQPNDGGGGGGQRSGQSSDQQHQQQFPGGWDDLD